MYYFGELEIASLEFGTLLRLKKQGKETLPRRGEHRSKNLTRLNKMSHLECYIFFHVVNKITSVICQHVYVNCLMLMFNLRGK